MRRNFTLCAGKGRRLPTLTLQSFITLMRISTLCLALMMGVGLSALEAGATYGQSTETTFLDIEAKHVPLATVFSMIEDRTEFLFVFPPELVASHADVSVMPGKKSVKDILGQILGGAMQYRESGKNIVVYAGEAAGQSMFMNVRGKVTDKNGAPMPGISVLVKGTTNGTVTDKAGEYALEASSSDWLVFSSIGYKKIEVQVGERSVVDQVIEEETQVLDAFEVSTGYYEMSDRLKTANITKITSKEITGQTVTSPLMALLGRVPGLELSLRSGAPGTAPLVRIRGNNSLRPQGGYPLFVIDGVVIDSSPMNSQSSLYISSVDPLAGINPENIESIEVLKDADATAIYGSRGANGVILIKTKLSKGNTATGVQVNAYQGTGEIPHFMNLLNTKQYLEMRKEAFRNGGAKPGLFDFDLTSWDSTKYTSWQKELLGGTSRISDVELAFLGGDERTSFRINGGYHRETSFVSDNFGFDRASAGVTFSHRSADNRFIVSTTANYGLTKNKILNLSPFIERALVLPPNAPDLYKEDGNLEWGPIYISQNFTLTSLQNPMAELRRTNENTIGGLVANTNLSYLLMKDLIIKTNLGYTDVNGDELIKDPILARSPTDIGSGTTGTAYFGTNKRRSYIIEPQASYDLKLADHDLSVLLGATFQQSTSLWRGVQADGYPSDVLLGTLKGATSYGYSRDTDTKYRYAAVFARIGYNWREKYLVNLTGRRDGSSRFGPGNQFGNFGAVGAAWIFSSENFMSNVLDILSFGKLRGSYGTTGNDQIDDYAFYDLYEIGKYRPQNTITLLPKGLYNPDYRWETTKKIEVALELSFLKDRLSMQTSWYRNRSSNQIFDYQLPATTGFPYIRKNFDATVENTGWEFFIQTRNIETNSFSWSTSINMTLPKNRLLSFPGIDVSPYATQFKIGEPLSIQNHYIWKGVDPQTGLHVFADLDDSGTLNGKDRVFGNPLGSKYYGGVMNTLRYMGLELSFLFQLVKQKSVGPYSAAPGGSISNQPEEVMTRWAREGDVTNVGKFSTDFEVQGNFYNVLASDYNIVDASFIRLRTFSLSYVLPVAFLEKFKVKQTRIFVQGQNLLTITDFVGLDPETGARVMPQMRTITGGISVKF